MLITALTLSLYADCFDVLHGLISNCSTHHGHARGHQDLLIEIGNFWMLYIASTLPLHADCFDVLHNLLQHCFTLHGHVRGHQDQLLGVGEFLNVVHCIYFASSRWSFWCATWPISTLLHTSWPCPWPPRSTSWGWRTFKCCTLHPLCLFMLILLNAVHCIYFAFSFWLFWCTAWHTSTL